MKLFATMLLAFSATAQAESFTCAKGEPSSFILEAAQDLANAPEVIVNEVTLSKFSPDALNQIQLDVCVVDETQAELQALHVLDHGQKHHLTQIIKAEGLAPALFGEVGALNITMAMPEGLVYEVRGWDSSLVSAMPLNGTEAIDDRVLVGSLAYGAADFANEAPSTNCLADETERQESFKIVDARVTGIVCSKLTADRSTAIRFVSATLVDTIDGQEIRHEFTAADFDLKSGSFRYHWTHHNLSDQLSIKTHEGIYLTKRGPQKFADHFGEAKAEKPAIRHSIGWVPMGIEQRITYAGGEVKSARDSDALSIFSVDNQ